MLSTLSLMPARRRPESPVLRANFNHLILDIGWFGLLNGSAIAFAAIFAVRQGATPLEVGLLGASPAIVNLLFALPAGYWLQNRAVGRSVFWLSVGNRLFYLLWAMLPLLLWPRVQVWGLILLTWLMSIPGTALAIGFNNLFAAAVPPEWRDDVVGRRNGLFALATVLTSFLCAQILSHLPSAQGYQVVFFLGFIGAAMSSVHLWFVRPVCEPTVARGPRPSSTRLSYPAANRGWWGLPANFAARVGGRLEWPAPAWRGIIGLLFLFHFGQYLAIPLFPIYWVNRLDLPDAILSLGNAVFYVVLFLMAGPAARWSQRQGNRKVLALGMVGMALYPALTTVTWSVPMYWVTSIVGGLVWGLVAANLSNYLLAVLPADRRPLGLAWYNIALHGGILAGSLLGPLLVEWISLPGALLLAAAVRWVAGGVFWLRTGVEMETETETETETGAAVGGGWRRPLFRAQHLE